MFRCIGTAYMYMRTCLTSNPLPLYMYMYREHYAKLYCNSVTVPRKIGQNCCNKHMHGSQLWHSIARRVHERVGNARTLTCSYTWTIEPARAWTLAVEPHTGCEASVRWRTGFR